MVKVNLAVIGVLKQVLAMPCDHKIHLPRTQCR